MDNIKTRERIFNIIVVPAMIYRNLGKQMQKSFTPLSVSQKNKCEPSCPETESEMKKSDQELTSKMSEKLH